MNNFIEVNNIYKALEKAKKDEAVGIKIIKLSGDDQFALYAAEIDGYKKVGAHYHTKGNEIYQIVEGRGKMYTGLPKAKEVDWQEPLEVNKGDCFTISENQAHQLVNTDAEKLIIMFICPYTHLSTDRIIVNNSI